jgi:predicted nucleic acid-binding protein
VTAILVDSNVILDVLTRDSTWESWSSRTLLDAANRYRLVINAIIYAEVSVRFSKIEEFESVLPSVLEREPIPYPAAFLAGKVFALYRKRSGTKLSPLPDFFIGAHAAVGGYKLLTRDTSLYQTYFPGLSLITP